MYVPPFAWGVVFSFNGEKCKFITLERSRADDYAATHHGIIVPLYEPDQFVILSQEEGASTKPSASPVKES